MAHRPSRAIRWLRAQWQRQILAPMRDADLEVAEHLATRPGLDTRTLIVCVVVALNLTLLYYFGLSNHAGWVPDALFAVGLDGPGLAVQQAIEGPLMRFWTLVYWASSCLVLYFVLPALIVKFVFREQLSEFGLRLRGVFKHLWIYVLFFAVIAPLVAYVSTTEVFQQQYPFYRAYSDRIPPYFPVWECVYALQFLALEFFFRGFMVHGLKHRFGYASIFVAAVPYCMIHFNKPFPETLGAIIAGVVLGFLSLRTGSVWLGFLLHVSVAVSMDLAALSQMGLL